MSRFRRWGLLLGTFLIVGLVGWWGLPRLRPHVFHGMVMQSPELAPDFTLTDHTGRPVSLRDFRGKLVLLYFGYTFCPDVCPTTMAELAKAMNLLGKKADRVQVIMISVDPARDTPEKLAEYVTHFHPSFLGLTGTPDEIAQIAALYGIFYEKQEGTEATGYLVNHTATVTVIDRKGYVRLIFPFGTSAEAIADDLAYLLR